MAAVPSDSSLSLAKSPVPESVPARFLQSVLDRVTPAADSLRGSFLFSLVLVILVMTFCTLLAVRQLIEVRAERQTAQDAQNSLLTFQVMSRQQHMALSRKAELLATLTFLRAGETTAIREASHDPWQSEDCDLFALTDRAGKITALETRGEAPPSASNEAIGNLLRASNATLADDTRKPTLDWWINGDRLYQIVVSPVGPDRRTGRPSSGQVIVGHNLDAARVKEFAHILSADLVFRQGNRILSSSLSPFEEQQLSIVDASSPDATQLVVHNKRYFVSSLKLSSESSDDLNLLVLKSDAAALASIDRLNLLLILLGLTAVVLGGILVYFISSTFTKPLDSLVEGVRALEQGDFSYPLAAVGGDELGTVTRAFDSMRSTLQNNEAQRKQLEDDLRQSQKMDALCRLAGRHAGWGHAPHRTAQCNREETLRRQADPDDARPLPHVRRPRQRFRHDPGSQSAHLRAVLYHQGTRQRHRPRPRHRLRHRQPKLRLHSRRLFARHRNAFRNLPSANRPAVALQCRVGFN